MSVDFNPASTEFVPSQLEDQRAYVQEYITQCQKNIDRLYQTIIVENHPISQWTEDQLAEAWEGCVSVLNGIIESDEILLQQLAFLRCLKEIKGAEVNEEAYAHLTELYESLLKFAPAFEKTVRIAQTILMSDQRDLKEKKEDLRDFANDLNELKEGLESVANAPKYPILEYLLQRLELVEKNIGSIERLRNLHLSSLPSYDLVFTLSPEEQQKFRAAWEDLLVVLRMESAVYSICGFVSDLDWVKDWIKIHNPVIERAQRIFDQIDFSYTALLRGIAARMSIDGLSKYEEEGLKITLSMDRCGRTITIETQDPEIGPDVCTTYLFFAP